MIEVTEEILGIANQMAELYNNAIRDTGHSASGKLASTTAFAKFDGRYFRIYFRIADYWKYLENGRRAGKMPPIDVIERWIQVKPVIPRAINNKIPTTRQLAFLIARKIGREGTPATKLLQHTLQSQQMKNLIHNIATIIISQLSEEIKEEIKEEQ